MTFQNLERMTKLKDITTNTNMRYLNDTNYITMKNNAKNKLNHDDDGSSTNCAHDSSFEGEVLVIDGCVYIIGKWVIIFVYTYHVSVKRNGLPP